MIGRPGAGHLQGIIGIFLVAYFDKIVLDFLSLWLFLDHSLGRSRALSIWGWVGPRIHFPILIPFLTHDSSRASTECLLSGLPPVRPNCADKSYNILCKVMSEKYISVFYLLKSELIINRE
jgi:hypothetical protein